MTKATAEEVKVIMVDIPIEMQITYGIKVEEKRIYINSPAYISIEYDEKFAINKGGSTIEIRNKKVSVELFRNFTDMHITVF